MSSPTNADRAEWARAGLAAFMASHAADDDKLTSIGDLITDLLHLARREHGLTVDDFGKFLSAKATMAEMEIEHDDED